MLVKSNEEVNPKTRLEASYTAGSAMTSCFSIFVPEEVNGVDSLFPFHALSQPHSIGQQNVHMKRLGPNPLTVDLSMTYSS